MTEIEECITFHYAIRSNVSSHLDPIQQMLEFVNNKQRPKSKVEPH